MTANKFYETLLVYDEVVEEEKQDEVLGLLSETKWWEYFCNVLVISCSPMLYFALKLCHQTKRFFGPTHQVWQCLDKEMYHSAEYVES